MYGGTTLVFTHRYIRAGDQRQGFGAGWHALFDTLNAYLGGYESVDDIARYQELPRCTTRASRIKARVGLFGERSVSHEHNPGDARLPD